MRPSEIREQIVADHRRVLPLLDRVERCAVLVSEGRGDRQQLRDIAVELEGVLAALMDEEREILHPELRQADAWGDVRVSKIEHKHRMQLAMLERARTRSDTDRRMAELMLEAVAAIRVDFNKEEHRYLSPDVLHDDLVSVAQSDG